MIVLVTSILYVNFKITFFFSLIEVNVTETAYTLIVELAVRSG